MNELVPMSKQGSDTSMTTKEISLIIDKRHDNVMRGTEKMLVKLYGMKIVEERIAEKDSDKVDTFISKNLKSLIKETLKNIGHLKFEATYKDESNRNSKCYKLDKEHTICLMGKYDDVLRMKMINHINKLETAITQASTNLDSLIKNEISTQVKNQIMPIIENINSSIDKVSFKLDNVNKLIQTENRKTKHFRRGSKTLKELCDKNDWHYDKTKRKLISMGYIKIEKRIMCSTGLFNNNGCDFMATNDGVTKFTIKAKNFMKKHKVYISVNKETETTDMWGN